MVKFYGEMATAGFVCVFKCVRGCMMHIRILISRVCFVCATGTTRLVASGERKNCIRLVVATDVCECMTETCVVYRMGMTNHVPVD